MSSVLRPEIGSPFIIAITLATGCATSYRAEGGDPSRSPAAWGARQIAAHEDDEVPAFDGTLEGYLAYAMRHSPELESAYEDWRAAELAIAPAETWPEPVISYAYFVRSVETRVGPQNHRFGLRQSLPWPSALDAAAEAEVAIARAKERAFEATALALRQRVATAYWRLWLVRRVREIEERHREILGELSRATLARLEVSGASLADVSQIDLAISRMDETIQSRGDEERSASAALLAAIGAPRGVDTPTSSSPTVARPAESAEALLQAALENPRLRAFEHLAESREQRARRASADGLPRFMVGLDYIATGEAAMPGVADSGKDPLMVSVSMSLPLWRKSYDNAEEKARAEAASFRAKGRAARLAAEAELERALSAVADSARRVALYHTTLLPQSETVYSAVTGEYQAGESGLAAVLLAQKDLLELRQELARAEADNARTWAELEDIVGREVESEALR